MRECFEMKEKTIKELKEEYSNRRIKQIDKLDRVEQNFGMHLSDNPYRARIQRTAGVLLVMSIIMKFVLLGAGLYQLLCIAVAGFMRNDTRIMDKMSTYNIFVHGMRDFEKLPGVPKLHQPEMLMISHFIILLVIIALLYTIRVLYKMLLNVVNSGNPFTKNVVKSLRKMCAPFLILMFWNIPISLCFIAFVLFISFIFDYGIYLQEKANETLSVQEDVILSFAEITEAKSGQTGQHVKRVSEYTKLLATEMGFSEEKVEELRVASMMHDVGKLLIPSQILDKPGKLTDEEFAEIKKHTEYGRKLLENAHGDIMETSRIVALEHHEKWDGNGYAHIAGDNISIEGRIVAVADVYDALTSRRSYKEAWAEDEAYEEIVKCSGTHFDPKVVEAFKSCYSKIQEVRRMYADA